MSLRRRLAGVENADSVSNRLRQKRFGPFARMLETAYNRGARPVRVLDVGGNQFFWEQRGLAGDERFHFTTLDLGPQPAQRHENVVPVQGNACAMPQYDDNSFDLVFSNSVIEHVGSFEDQRAMAAEVRRLAPGYYVQTPNYWFPLEPHFLVPGWQWMPRPVRIAAIRRRKIGHIGPFSDADRAAAAVDEIRLLKRSEVQRLFPDAEVSSERIAGLTKSFVAIRES